MEDASRELHEVCRRKSGSPERYIIHSERLRHAADRVFIVKRFEIYTPGKYIYKSGKSQVGVSIYHLYFGYCQAAGRFVPDSICTSKHDYAKPRFTSLARDYPEDVVMGEDFCDEIDNKAGEELEKYAIPSYKEPVEIGVDRSSYKSAITVCNSRIRDGRS